MIEALVQIDARGFLATERPRIMGHAHDPYDREQNDEQRARRHGCDPPVVLLTPRNPTAPSEAGSMIDRRAGCVPAAGSVGCICGTEVTVCNDGCANTSSV